MPESDSDHGVDEALEGEIVQEGSGPAAGGGAASGARPGPAGSGARPAPAGITFTVPVDAEAFKERRDNAAVTFGAVLVVVGAVLLGGRFSDVVAAGGPALWIGLGFLTWWAFSGNYGLLVPAGVLTGLGVGLMLAHVEFYGNPVALGLGVGFLAMYALDALRSRSRSSWWPLVPGAVLVLVGLLQNTSGWDSLGDLGWPLLLIVVGIIIIGGALARRVPRS
ncbi:MAG: hypothetical protein NTW58_05610 [Actinobacteria bacterium]|nr:hypothetical protein [Actinomycetota bacterium]